MRYQQLKMFDVETAAPDDSRSSFNDPAFANNKTAPIHRWVPWIAGFSKTFVRDVIIRYLDGPGLVLDPFAGVGTTLVEAVLQGHEALGFEINPYAALASRVKANAHRIDPTALEVTIARFYDFYQSKVSSPDQPLSSPPPGFRTRSAFYSPKVLRKVLFVQDFVRMLGDDLDIKDVFSLAFAATMVRYSNYSYEPSLGRRTSAGKDEILDFDVGGAIFEKLEAMLEDLFWFREHLPAQRNQARVINESFFKVREYLDRETVDLLITSPPYLNNYHYNRNTRPQLYWLGYADQPKDLKPLEQANFGKYWQTVRGDAPHFLDFSLPGSDLVERLAMLRERRKDKGVYGGVGWANYAVTYFNDCYTFAQGIDYALKPGGTALVVIGNSILQGIMMPTDEYFGAIAESVGLDLVGIAIPRETRVGNSIIQSDVRVEKAKDAHQLYEAIVELRKP